MANKTTAVSVKYTESQQFSQSTKRQYLMIVAGTGDTTVEFGDGGGEIPISGFIEPYHVPISDIKIRTTGDYYLLTEQETHNTAAAIT